MGMWLRPERAEKIPDSQRIGLRFTGKRIFHDLSQQEKNKTKKSKCGKWCEEAKKMFGNLKMGKKEIGWLVSLKNEKV